jgi:hypothetical protein
MKDNITLRRAWCEYTYYILERKLREIKEDHLGLLFYSNVAVSEEGSVIEISTFLETKNNYLNLDYCIIHGSC